jgi:hypothetical protein
VLRELLIGLSCTTTVALLAGCALAPNGTTVGAGANTTPPSATSVEPIAINRATSPADTAAFAVLAEVAPTSLILEGGTVTSTACWTPSEHLFQDESIATATTWKVLCRVYYTLAGHDRFQDTTCIGDFELSPMLDHCYRWAYYNGEARFTDGDRLASPAPTATP